MDREFGRPLPHSEEPLEQSEEWYAAITSRHSHQYILDVGFVMDELRDLVQAWREASCAERHALTEPREKHRLPLEYSAGLAQGLENAANDLARIIEEAS